MKVARQFIAWNRFNLRRLPYGTSDSCQRLIVVPDGTTLIETNHTVPYGTVLFSNRFQAMNAWLPSFSPSGTSPTKSSSRPG
ncbi:MAG TPA: hypothetical protein VK673_19690 [Chthoniobacterales bacterium]|nr:hypothetical protein [Chthoniobacterales bacterium]